MRCIVIGMAGRQRAGARHDTAQQATARPRYGQAACDTTRSACGWELGRDTTIVSWLRGGRPCVVIQCSQGLRYGAQRPATCVAERGTLPANDLSAGCVAIQAATWPTRPATRPATSHDTAWHRPTTRPA